MHPDDPAEEGRYIDRAGQEGVVAIGWGVDRDPRDPLLTREEHLALLEESYPQDRAEYAIGWIEAFMQLPRDARIFIITGYPPRQRAPVPVHAVARLHARHGYRHVIGEQWWFQHQRPVSIFRRFESAEGRAARVPVEVFKAIQGSMMRVLHGPYSDGDLEPLTAELNALGFNPEV